MSEIVRTLLRKNTVQSKEGHDGNKEDGDEDRKLIRTACPAIGAPLCAGFLLLILRDIAGPRTILLAVVAAVLTPSTSANSVGSPGRVKLSNLVLPAFGWEQLDCVHELLRFFFSFGPFSVSISLGIPVSLQSGNCYLPTQASWRGIHRVVFRA